MIRMSVRYLQMNVMAPFEMSLEDSALEKQTERAKLKAAGKTSTVRIGDVMRTACGRGLPRAPWTPLAQARPGGAVRAKSKESQTYHCLGRRRGV